MFKKFIFLALTAVLFFTGCNDDDKFSIQTINKQRLKLTDKDVLMIAENASSNHFDSYKANEIRRIGYVTVPYTVTYKDHTVSTKNGTGLLIETTNGKTYQMHIQENSNVVSILKNNGFNVIEAFVQIN